MTKVATKLTAAFAAAVKRHRKRRGISQEKLAESAAVHRTYVGLIERGERTPTIDVAERIAKAFGLSLSALIKEAEREL